MIAFLGSQRGFVQLFHPVKRQLFSCFYQIFCIYGPFHCYQRSCWIYTWRERGSEMRLRALRAEKGKNELKIGRIKAMIAEAMPWAPNFRRWVYLFSSKIRVYCFKPCRRRRHHRHRHVSRDSIPLSSFFISYDLLSWVSAPSPAALRPQPRPRPSPR